MDPKKTTQSKPPSSTEEASMPAEETPRAPEDSLGASALLTDSRQTRQDEFSQSGSVCLDELQELAHKCVQPGGDGEDGLLKLVYAYGAAEKGKHASKVQFLLRCVELGTASAAAAELKVKERTARQHFADFKAFAVLVLKEIHARKTRSEEAEELAEEKRAARKRLRQREFDAAWAQCRTQCPKNEDIRAEAPPSQDSGKPIRRTGCHICPLNSFWALRYDREMERFEERKARANKFRKEFGEKASKEAGFEERFKPEPRDGGEG